MNNQEITSQEQRRSAQLTGNQSQEPQVYETQSHRSKLSKDGQGTQSYESHIHKTKVSKNPENGTQSIETHVYRTIVQKPDQEETLPSGQPLVQSDQTQLQEIQQQQQPYDNQEAIQLPQQTIQSHEHKKHHRKEEEELYEKKPLEDYSNEKLHQESQLYGRQLPEKQPLVAPQLDEKSQEYQFQQQQQPEQVDFKQFEQPKVQHIQQQVPGSSPDEPPTTVVYEVYQTQVHPNAVLPQNNIQGAQLLPGAQILPGISPQTIRPGTSSSNLSTSNTWTQPLPDAQGSIVGKANYNLEEAKQDAMNLFRAMKGAGTDKNTVAEISGNRTFAQRQMIVSEYAHIDNKEKRDLLIDLKREVGGDLESLLLPLYMIPGEFDARLMEKALKGFKNNVEVLIELLCTRTNQELQDMKNAWKIIIDPKVRLEEKVHDETKSFFGTTNFHVLCLKLLEANRPPCATPDLNLVRLDAEDLYHQLVERNDVNNAKAKFVEVFTERSWSHLGAVVGEFQKISEKWTMEKAISQEFGTSSNTAKALQVMAEFCAQPYDFWAKRLKDAMEGLGTDDSKLVRIVVSRCEIDMNNIALVFGQRHGNGKNLKNWIEADTSGAYRILLLNLCGFH